GDVTGPATATCSSSSYSVAVTFTAGEGTKNVVLAQTDGATNATTVNRDFIRDNTIPTVTITAQPADPSNDTSPDFSFSGADNLAVASFECEMDGGGFSACTSPKNYAGPLSNASHTFKVRSLDGAGNVSNEASYTWTVDAQAPDDFTIAGARGGTDTTDDAWLGNTTVPTAVWNAAAGASSYDVVIRNSGDTANACGAPVNTAATSYNFAGCNLTEGASYLIKVTARDAAGNMKDATNNGYSFTVDTIAPVTQLTGLPANPSNAVNLAVTVGGTGSPSHYRYALGSNLIDCEDSGIYSTEATVATALNAAIGADGAKKLCVITRDLAGNWVDYASATVHMWTKDATAPGLVGALNDGTNYNSLTTSPAFTWTAASDGTGVGVAKYELAIGSGTSGAAQTDELSWTDIGNVLTYQATGLTLDTATTYYVSVRAVDSLGNTGTAAVSDGWLTVGNSAPVAVDDTATVDQNSAAGVVVSVLANDTDADAGDTLTVTAKTNGTNGTVTIEAGNTTVKYVPNAGFNGVDTFTYTVSDGTATDTGSVTVKVLNPFTWTGAAPADPTQTYWSNNANWHGGTAPTNADVAIFDATCSSNCSPTINASINVAGVRMNSGYTGTITQAAGQTITIGATGWLQAAGTFTGGDSSVTFSGNGPLTLTGGTYTATSATTTIRRNITITAPGTFAHNSGTVQVGVGASEGNSTINTDGVTFNHLTLRKDDWNTITNSADYNVAGNLVINTDGATTSFVNGGTISVAGNVTITNHFANDTGGTVKIRLYGTGAQTLSSAVSGYQRGVGGVIIDKPSGTLTLAGTIGVTHEWTHTQGTVDAGTSTVQFGVGVADGNCAISASGMTFNHVHFYKENFAANVITGTLKAAGNARIEHTGT
ncbi:MAG TPA: Ig-like domain-containing protein, partial [Bdellovibrionales bacterium]|nr:Ig-like domain-containing protein [Bdellovibrionales bacterium]